MLAGYQTSIGSQGVQQWQYETQDPFWPSTRQLTQMSESGCGGDGASLSHPRGGLKTSKQRVTHVTNGSSKGIAERVLMQELLNKSPQQSRIELQSKQSMRSQKEAMPFSPDKWRVNSLMLKASRTDESFNQSRKSSPSTLSLRQPQSKIEVRIHKPQELLVQTNSYRSTIAADSATCRPETNTSIKLMSSRI